MAKNIFLAELILKDSSILIASDVFGPKTRDPGFFRTYGLNNFIFKKIQMNAYFLKNSRHPNFGDICGPPDPSRLFSNI